MKYKIEEGTLTFNGVSVGNLITGEALSWDELRRIVIVATRFATGRKVEDRTLKELRADVDKFVNGRNESIDGKDEEIANLKRDLHNRDRIIESYRDRCGEQNQEINDWKQRYIDTARALQEQQKEG